MPGPSRVAQHCRHRAIVFQSVTNLLQPLEAVSPVILNPHLDPKKPVAIELLNKVRYMQLFSQSMSTGSSFMSTESTGGTISS